MRVKITEHLVPKKTRYGTVQKSLNQYFVWIENPDTKKFMHCGYFPMNDPKVFKPLVGFPKELLDVVCSGIQESLAEQGVFDEKPKATDPPVPYQSLEEEQRNRFNEENDDDE